MPYWTIYVSDPGRRRAGMGQVTEAGQFWALVADPPNLEALSEAGLGAAYFGEDPPDLEALTWCPKRLSFVDRASVVGAGSETVDALRAALSEQQAELERLSARMAQLEGEDAPRPAARLPWWKRWRREK